MAFTVSKTVGAGEIARAPCRLSAFGLAFALSMGRWFLTLKSEDRQQRDFVLALIPAVTSVGGVQGREQGGALFFRSASRKLIPSPDGISLPPSNASRMTLSFRSRLAQQAVAPCPVPAASFGRPGIVCDRSARRRRRSATSGVGSSRLRPPRRRFAGGLKHRARRRSYLWAIVFIVADFSLTKAKDA